jgi:hypothetical protein
MIRCLEEGLCREQEVESEEIEERVRVLRLLLLTFYVPRLAEVGHGLDSRIHSST